MFAIFAMKLERWILFHLALSFTNPVIMKWSFQAFQLCLNKMFFLITLFFKFLDEGLTLAHVIIYVGAVFLESMKLTFWYVLYPKVILATVCMEIFNLFSRSLTTAEHYYQKDYIF